MAEVADPARAFLAEHDGPAPGSVVAPTLEGSRPLLVEVQGLVAPGPGGTPRRTASGVDANRVALLVAVLARRAGIGLASHDIYVNLAGGLAVDEPGLDLPLALALASSLRDRPIPSGTVAIGEVGLLGELRSVVGLERRLREAARLGFGRAIVPRPARGPAVPASRASRSSRSAACARRSRRPCRRAAGPRAGWRRDRRDARLRRLQRASGSVARPPRDGRREGTVIRNIRLLGAAIGGLVGLALAASARLFEQSPAGGWLLVAWVVAWIVVGFAILPYLTVVPGRLADPPGAAALDRGVRDRGRRPPDRPPDGPPARPAARRSSRSRSGRWLPIGVSLFLGLGMLGLTVAKRDDLLVAAEAIGLVRRPRPEGERTATTGDPHIVVDTSAIIDGRIAEIVESGFIYGTLVVPKFVLDELQHIADSSDTLRRNRGRRGLEILARMQKDSPTPIEIIDEPCPRSPRSTRSSSPSPGSGARRS